MRVAAHGVHARCGVVVRTMLKAGYDNAAINDVIEAIAADSDDEIIPAFQRFAGATPSPYTTNSTVI